MKQNTPETAWYNKTWLVILLCLLFFPVGLYALWKNENFSKGVKIGVTALILILVIANIASKTGKKDAATASTTAETSSTSSPAAAAEPAKKAEWTEVYTFKGNGMKKSPVFHLNGNEARLKYNYKAPGSLGMGVFSAYVMDKGEDLMKTGGIPDVMTQAESEESESSIQKSEGDYYLYINASGSWTVTVEELR